MIAFGAGPSTRSGGSVTIDELCVGLVVVSASARAGRRIGSDGRADRGRTARRNGTDCGGWTGRNCIGVEHVPCALSFLSGSGAPPHGHV
eukprot:7384006-Prymnesium_polylepis.1